MGCECQSCGNQYIVDILVEDEIWNMIKPENKPKGSGMLCGKCIFQRLEDLEKYGAYKLMGLIMKVENDGK